MWCTNQIIQTNTAFWTSHIQLYWLLELPNFREFWHRLSRNEKIVFSSPLHLKHRSVSPKYKLISYNGPVEHVSEIVVSMPYHVGTYTWGFSYRWPREPFIWTKLFHMDLFRSVLSLLWEWLCNVRPLLVFEYDNNNTIIWIVMLYGKIMYNWKLKLLTVFLLSVTHIRNRKY